MIAAGLAISAVPAAYGQRWEFGAAGGASFYNSLTATGRAGGTVDAKFKPGGGVGVYLGQIGNRLGGEARYTWLYNGMELSGAGNNFSMGGYSQTITYNMLIYFADKTKKTRPYVLAGGGGKLYTGTGGGVAIQPLQSIVVLTNTSQWKPVIVFGGGVRFAVSPKSQLRAEFLVNMTQNPDQVITPVNGASLSGWYFNYMPMVGLSYAW